MANEDSAQLDRLCQRPAVKKSVLDKPPRVVVQLFVDLPDVIDMRQRRTCEVADVDLGDTARGEPCRQVTMGFAVGNVFKLFEYAEYANTRNTQSALRTRYPGFARLCDAIDPAGELSAVPAASSSERRLA